MNAQTKFNIGQAVWIIDPLPRPECPYLRIAKLVTMKERDSERFTEGPFHITKISISEINPYHFDKYPDITQIHYYLREQYFLNISLIGYSESTIFLSKEEAQSVIDQRNKDMACLKCGGITRQINFGISHDPAGNKLPFYKCTICNTYVY